MKKILFQFILLTAVGCQPAHAYDDQESAKVYGRCLIQQQRAHHFSADIGGERNSIHLFMICQREAMDFMRYNCPGNPEACEDVAIYAAETIARKLP